MFINLLLVTFSRMQCKHAKLAHRIASTNGPVLAAVPGSDSSVHADSSQDATQNMSCHFYMTTLTSPCHLVPFCSPVYMSQLDSRGVVSA